MTLKSFCASCSGTVAHRVHCTLGKPKDDSTYVVTQTVEKENAALREQLKDCSAAFDRQQEMLDRNAEQNAALRDALSRLIEVHDAMGGKCGTARIAAEEALAKEEGK